MLENVCLSTIFFSIQFLFPLFEKNHQILKILCPIYLSHFLLPLIFLIPFNPECRFIENSLPGCPPISGFYLCLKFEFYFLVS